MGETILMHFSVLLTSSSKCTNQTILSARLSSSTVPELPVHAHISCQEVARCLEKILATANQRVVS